MTNDPPASETVAVVTVLFADMSGSTAMYASRGDAAAYRIASRCIAIMEQAVTAEGGRVVKRVGDGILAVFDGVEPSVLAAANLVAGVRDHAEARVRVGISHGQAVLEPDDVYGDVVNVAARLVARGRPDEILLSGGARAALPPEMQRCTRFLDDVAVRGREARVAVHQFVGVEKNLTVAVRTAPIARASMLELRWGDDGIVLSADRPRCRIGRGSESDVRVDDGAVSRHHAEIALRGDKFVLADWSTNGTLVHREGMEPIRLLREELVLADAGTIHVGTSSAGAIAYRLLAG